MCRLCVWCSNDGWRLSERRKCFSIWSLPFHHITVDRFHVTDAKINADQYVFWTTLFPKNHIETGGHRGMETNIVIPGSCFKEKLYVLFLYFSLCVCINTHRFSNFSKWVFTKALSKRPFFTLVADWFMFFRRPVQLTCSLYMTNMLSYRIVAVLLQLIK